MDVHEHNFPSRYSPADPAFDKRGNTDLLCAVELTDELTTVIQVREGSLTLDE